MLVASILVAILACVNALPASEKEIALADNSLALQAVHMPVTMEHSSDLYKRELFLERTLNATYYYHCPLAGPKRRSFIWRANWRSSDGQLKVSAVEHINHIGDIVKSPPSFSVDWRGDFCIQIGWFQCTYVHTGVSEGTITHTGIVMSLVTLSNYRRLLPKVTEQCISMANVPQGTCPVPGPEEHVTPCNIVNIEVEVVHH